MAPVVCAGAQVMCSFGSAPAVLTVLPASRVLTAGRPVASTMDHKPLLNIPTFGTCSSLANPLVAAATAAAAGVLTPAPCIPATATPWVPGSPTVQAGPFPALQATSQCHCSYAGVVTVAVPGQFTVSAP